MPTFNKQEKILKACEFERVKEHGVRSFANALFISYLKAEKKRLGLIVTKKIGNAVRRNKIKRVIREHFRLNKEAYPIGDCVVIINEKASKLENIDICKNLDKALQGFNKKQK